MNIKTQQKIKVLLADFLSTNIAVLLFNVFRYYDIVAEIQGFGSLEQFLLSPMVLAGQIVFPVVMLGVYFLCGGYDNIFQRSRTAELSMTLIAAFIGTLLFFFAVLINDLTLERSRDYTLFVVLLQLLYVLVCIPRILLTWRLNNRIWYGEITFPAAIVGYSSNENLYSVQIQNIARSTGIKPVILIDADNNTHVPANSAGLPLINMAGIAEACIANGVDRIIVIPHPDGWDRTLAVVNDLIALDLPLYVAADNLPPYIFSTRLQGLTEEPFIDVARPKMSVSSMHIKRLCDVILSLLALVVVFVPMVFVALAVKIDSKGPIFYRQNRVGLHRRQFKIIKLRTMRCDAEADGRPRLSRPGDTRVTRLGRVLRKYRIDEIPQLINILLGDMSLVGPRPERPEFVEEMRLRNPATTLIFSVRPGLTSLGMVRYGYASDIDGMMRRLQYDLLYLENMSLLTDLKIILFTVRTVLLGKGV